MRRGVLRVGKNMGVLIGSHVVNRLLYVVLVGALGRLLGAAALGGYAIAVAISAGFLFATDLGLSPFLVREIAARPEGGSATYARACGIKLAVSAVALAGLPLLRLALPYDSWVLDLCVLMAVAAVIESFSQLNNAVCRAHEHMELEALSAATQSVVTVGLSLWMLLAGLPPVWLGWAAIAGSAAELLVSTLLVRHLVHPRVELPPRWSMLRAASPYAVTSLNAVAFFQAEVLVLSFIVGQAEVGQFASVSRLLQGGGYVAVLAGGAILPTLTIAYARRERETFRAIGSTLLRAGLLAGGGAAALVWVMAGPIMAGVYGRQFAELSSLLRLGCLYLLIKCFSELLAVLLTASGRQAVSAASRLLGAASTWLLILLLTPAFGVTAAVLSLALGEALACLIQAARIGDLVRLPLPAMAGEDP